MLDVVSLLIYNRYIRLKQREVVQMGFYRAGSKIVLTERQEDKIYDQCEKAKLTCRIEQCWTGSVYVVIDYESNTNYNPLAKIRLSNHDEGVRGDETTHNAVGTKGEIMGYLNEWLSEIIEDFIPDDLPEEEKIERLRKKAEKEKQIEAEKIKKEKQLIVEQKRQKIYNEALALAFPDFMTRVDFYRMKAAARTVMNADKI